jgi:hypothetical protein
LEPGGDEFGNFLLFRFPWIVGAILLMWILYLTVAGARQLDRSYGQIMRGSRSGSSWYLNPRLVALPFVCVIAIVLYLIGLVGPHLLLYAVKGALPVEG